MEGLSSTPGDTAPEGSLPEPLKSREPLVLDLRDGWRLGRPRSSTRLELLRAIAGIAAIPLRELIPWDQARRRQTTCRMPLPPWAA